MILRVVYAITLLIAAIGYLKYKLFLTRIKFALRLEVLSFADARMYLMILIPKNKQF
jgi:hypothetical protein